MQVAKKYPQGLFYQFKISVESMPHLPKARIAALAAELSDPLLESFVAALGRCVPIDNASCCCCFLLPLPQPCHTSPLTSLAVVCG